MSESFGFVPASVFLQVGETVGVRVEGGVVEVRIQPVAPLEIIRHAVAIGVDAARAADSAVLGEPDRADFLPLRSELRDARLPANRPAP